MKALIIVDLQNDFVMGGSLAVPAGEEIIPLVNRLQDHFDLIVATQDWHPRDHGSHATNHPGRDPGDVIELAGWRQDLDRRKGIRGQDAGGSAQATRQAMRTRL